MRRSTYLRVIALGMVLVMLALCFVGCTPDEGPSLSLGDKENATPKLYVESVDVIEGSIIVTYSDGSTKNLGSSVTNVTNNDITINAPEGTQESVLAVSTAMLSTVGVQCAFTETGYIMNGVWGGGYTTYDKVVYAYGSGVIYELDKTAGDAYIITNYHVVYDSAAKEEDGISQNIHVYLRGGSEIMEATFVGGSPIYDIAVLRVEDNAVLRASAAEAVKVRNSDTLQVGEASYAVGNPEAGGISATAGIVSVDSEYITMNAVDGSATNVKFRVVRVDAAINSGNSGGGLYDAQGNLIGITNAKISSSTVENIGFAIPTTVAVAVAQNVIDYHEEDPENDGVYRALMGITTTISSSSMTYDPQTGLTGLTQTVLVDVVSEDGLAQAAGLEKGDALVSIKVGNRDVVLINRQHQIIDAMLWARAGDVITIVYVDTNGVTQTSTITMTAESLQKY